MQYNTCFWALVHGGKSHQEAQAILKAGASPADLCAVLAPSMLDEAASAANLVQGRHTDDLDFPARIQFDSYETQLRLVEASGVV